MLCSDPRRCSVHSVTGADSKVAATLFKHGIRTVCDLLSMSNEEEVILRKTEPSLK